MSVGQLLICEIVKLSGMMLYKSRQKEEAKCVTLLRIEQVETYEGERYCREKAKCG